MSGLKFYNRDSVFNQTNPNHELMISIWDEDSLTAAQKHPNSCILNFASHKRPGGGYKAVIGTKMPIKTQEEDLFRRSNLPELMDTEEIRKYYPLKELDSLYCVGTANKDKTIEDCEPFDFGLITMPALVRPSEDQYDGLIKEKIQTIFKIAIDNNHDALILGAWGCGVFHNDPDKIAELFLDEAENTRGFFKELIFCIPGKNSVNYQVFLKEMEKR